jgi:membrane protease subunit HflC
MNKNVPLIIFISLVVLVTMVLTAFTVDQRQAAIRFRLGEVVDVHIKPGLYFRVPLIENIRIYDTRIQTLDTKDAERIQTSEKNNVLVDSFVKYRIIDVKQFFVSTRGDITAAEVRLAQSINNDLRDEFSQRTLAEVISGERDKIMDSTSKPTAMRAALALRCLTFA